MQNPTKEVELNQPETQPLSQKSKPKHFFSKDKDLGTAEKTIDKEKFISPDDKEKKPRGRAAQKKRIEEEILALPLVGGVKPFLPFLEALRKMRVHQIDPFKIQEMQDPDPGTALKSDGSNAARISSSCSGVGE